MSHVNNNIYVQKWCVGAHTDSCGSLYDTLTTSVHYGMLATQVCMGSMYSYNRSKPTDEVLSQCLKLVDRFPMHVFSHFPYVANLCGSVKTLAWHGNDEQDEKTKKVLQGLQTELEVMANFTAKTNGVVIHPGAYPDREKGLKNISTTINKIIFPKGSKLLLENSAGQGRTLATTFEEIATIIQGVDNKKHIGVCVDTAHIWGVGEYDLREISEIDRMFEEFEEYIGMERFCLLHLNDSKVELGSRTDRHESIGAGQIWSNSFDSLIHLMNKCESYGIPAVLETHGMDMITLAHLGAI